MNSVGGSGSKDQGDQKEQVGKVSAEVASLSSSSLAMSLRSLLRDLWTRDRESFFASYLLPKPLQPLSLALFSLTHDWWELAQRRELPARMLRWRWHRDQLQVLMDGRAPAPSPAYVVLGASLRGSLLGGLVELLAGLEDAVLREGDATPDEAMNLAVTLWISSLTLLDRIERQHRSFLAPTSYAVPYVAPEGLVTLAANVAANLVAAKIQGACPSRIPRLLLTNGSAHRPIMWPGARPWQVFLSMGVADRLRTQNNSGFTNGMPRYGWHQWVRLFRCRLLRTNR